MSGIYRDKVRHEYVTYRGVAVAWATMCELARVLASSLSEIT